MQPKQKQYNNIFVNTPKEKDYNFMADVLYLPTTKAGFKYLLVVIDLASNNFDIEPLKTKTSEETLKAYKTMVKRPYINLSKGSIRTDDGAEFKSVFNKFLIDNDIHHRTALTNRHKQQATVEALNRKLSKILMKYIISKEEKKKKEFNEWTEILNIVRKDLNEDMERDLSKYSILNEEHVYDIYAPQKYKVGDYVYEKLEHPEDSWGNKQPTAKRREGDYTYSRKAKRIIKVIIMNDEPYYRYILDGLKNVSYSENELQKVPAEEMNIIYDVLHSTTIGGRLCYAVRYEGRKYFFNEITKYDYVPASEIYSDDFLKWCLVAVRLPVHLRVQAQVHLQARVRLQSNRKLSVNSSGRKGLLKLLSCLTTTQKRALTQSRR
jgi:hypothetical protein